MISKLPRWVWLCAWILAFIAGMINVVGLLAITHQSVSHLTGNTSMLAVAVANSDLSAILRFAGVLGSFVAGTVASGFIIQDGALQLGNRYGVALLLEATLLALAVPLLRHDSLGGICAAACACGVQNAMATTFSGTVVRTTHVSGMFTDLGIFLGHALRGLPIDTKRMAMCFLIISGFFTGGLAGVLAFHLLGVSTLFIPSAITAAASVGYAIYQLRNGKLGSAAPR